ncbi:27253_t:CDS:2 [Gigaspora margarita]|uniref:Lysine--tRNA ligase n=1 Tax=Gigaspora margarita TaxID=4874 RepID=A0ABM8VVN1_GIGMA|nr:27253_t:CDS:2 [Gigaspora margarita]
MELSLEELRKKKLADLSQNPFQQNRFSKTHNIQIIIKLFSQFSKEELIEKKEKVSIAGRITGKRMFFADLTDQSGTIQLKFSSKNEDLAKLDNGSIIGVKGIVCRTDKGQLSVEVKEFILLSKCSKPLPSSYYGLNDTEERFRNRHLDFIINKQKKEIFFLRHQVIKNIRQFLEEKSFVEIETPILVSEASGAQAKPFVTHHNKLHRDFYLRIATEIPLKKLLVGGFEKIYEIGRIFRNEGIDARHNPEFTTIEVYQAYENSEYMMNLTEELFHYLAEKIFEKEEFEFNSHNISLKKPFRRLSMIEAIREYANIDFAKINAQKHNLKLEKFQKSIGHVILAFFEEFAEKKLIQPTFIYDYPIEVSPLAKSKLENEKIADRFELYIGELEFANGYSELNDPNEQKRRFGEQTKQKELGNEEIASFDKEFIEALEYGMPPAGGLGIGIDRLIMLFTGQNSIKEVIAFPQLKKKWLEDIQKLIECGDVEEIHFIGSIIYKKNDETNPSFPEYLVIDGQQRITTFFVFCLVILEVLKKNNSKNGFLIENINQLLFISDSRELCPRLIMRGEDEKSLEAILRHKNSEDNKQRVFEAYEYFRKKFGGGSITGTHIKDYFEKLKNKFNFISIKLEKDDDALEIFKSINTSGVMLTSTDLIKAEFFIIYEDKKLDCYGKGEYSEKEFYTFFRDKLKLLQEKERENFYLPILEIKTLDIKQLYPLIIFLKEKELQGKKEANILKIRLVQNNQLESILKEPNIIKEIDRSNIFWDELEGKQNLKDGEKKWLLTKFYLTLLPEGFFLSSLQLEHMFPKKSDKEWWSIPEWRELKEDEKQIREKLHSLGNTTLLTLNKNITREEFRKNTCLQYEKNELNLLEKSVLLPEDIDKRKEWLIQQFKESGILFIDEREENLE